MDKHFDTLLNIMWLALCVFGIYAAPLLAVPLVPVAVLNAGEIYERYRRRL
jgi:hypothetical protein